MASLRIRLALLVLLAIVPALGLSVYDFVAQRRQGTAATYAEANRLAQLAIANQEQLMVDTRQLLSAMAQHSELRQLNSRECSRIAASLISPIFANLGASKPNGDIFCSALVMQGPVNNSDRAYFKRVMERRAFAIGEYQIGRITGKATLNAGYPVIGDSDQIIAVVFAAIDLDWLNQLASRAELPPGGTLSVWDGNGKILARYPNSEAWQGRELPDSALFKAIMSQNGEGVAAVLGLDGEPRLYAFQKLRIDGSEQQFYVAVGTPVAFAFAKINREFTRNLVGLGLAILLALTGTWVTGNALILQPTQALVQGARRIASGDRSARVSVGDGTGELGHLARAFNDMAESLQRQEIERRDSGEQLSAISGTLQAIIQASPVAIVATDTQGQVKLWNPAAERIFGWNKQEALDRRVPWVASEHEGDFHKILRAMLEGHSFNDLELRRRRKDGSPIDISISTAPLRDSTGEITGIMSVIADVTGRKQAEADRLAREAAEAANRAKSEFLSRMSHELRTPLNAIIGFGQLMEMDAVTPEQRENVDQILKAGRHLLNLINEILDIARIEAGRLSLSIEPVILQEIMDECQDLIRPSAAQRRIVLDLQTDLDNQIVMADRQRLKQVLLNLLSNAVKFNSEGGRVTLSCTPRPHDRLRIGVTDTGPGISPDSIGKLFTPFERLGAGQIGIEGTGLGLALSKTLTEAMQGSMGVESTVGRGSTFWIELPVARDIAPEADVRELAAAAAAGPTASARAVRTVLYIEDNLSNLKLLERVMARRPDVRLLTAMQGRLGLDLARQHLPDLILLDLDLPDVKGDQVLRTLRDDGATGDIPVVILTATATPGEIDRLLNSGARAYLTKPFDVKALFSLLDEIVAA
jgi:PAS domain S-box-containing protein